MGGDETVLGVVIAVVGGICSVLVARISTPRERPAPPAAAEADELPPPGLQVSPEIWQYVSGRFATLEAKVDNLTLLVETKKAEVSALERLLRQAMRIIRRANRRLVAVHEAPEEIPRELVPYSIE
ncbi:hypothetical protein AMK23_26385 [Streptomyces sp. CB02130]|uniref:hypothetical protein n=1 Tax=Streptomyces sp. CB02130 TaxID=1703934 RepID=UPI00093F131C|nr:hypothetical protein [Streptomyces sp. CB02130]OKJ24363.1 hypothetical protein AMK23_26385 [Streptomyces sp. CB02130]